MFEEKNSLPGSKLHSPIRNRNGLTRSRQNHADVRRHIVAALRAVREIMGIFRHQAVKEFLQVASRGWIGVLHDDEAATGVPDENSQRAGGNAATGEDAGNLVGDFEGPFAGGANSDRLGVDTQGRH